MIFEAIIGFASIVITQLLNIFPEVDASAIDSINSFYTTIRTNFADAAWFVPVDVFFQVFGIIILVESSVFVVRIVRYLTRLLTAGFVHA